MRIGEIQASRFELKYIISEQCSAAVRDFLRPHLVGDAHGGTGPAPVYTVNSLYLDSPDLALLRASQDGLRDRFKLRVRWYGQDAEAPEHQAMFFEVKRRVNRAVLKRRAVVRRDAAQRILDGHLPRDNDLVNPHSAAAATVNYFQHLACSINARPHLVLSYQREAWVSPQGNAVRVTFDRHLSTREYAGQLINGRSTEPFLPRVGGVILEMKFTSAFPHWMNELATAFSLAPRRVPKYVICAQALRSEDYEITLTQRRASKSGQIGVS